MSPRNSLQLIFHFYIFNYVETLEALENRISTERSKIPPAYLQYSGTEESDFDTTKRKEKNSEVKNFKTILDKKLLLKSQELLVSFYTIHCIIGFYDS